MRQHNGKQLLQRVLMRSNRSVLPPGRIPILLIVPACQVLLGGGVNRRPLSIASYQDDKLVSIQTNQLIDQTNILLEQSSMSDVDIIAVLTDWLHHTSPEALSNMQLLMEHWIATTTKYTTNQPFKLVLQKFAQVGEAHRAALLLDTWIGKLGGHLSLSPTLHDFHSVLEAYTRSSRVSIQAMLDLVSFMEHQDMCPTVQTYSLLVVGIVRDHTVYNNWTNVLTTAMNRMEEKWETSDQAYHYLRGYSRAIRWALKKKQWSLGQEWYAKIYKLLRHPSVIHATVEHQRLEAEDHVDKLVGNLTSDYLSLTFRLQEYQQQNKGQDPSMKDALNVLDTISALKLEYLPWANHYSIIIEMWSRTKRPGLLEFLKNTQDIRLAQGKQLPIAWYSLTLLHTGKLHQSKDCEDLLQTVMELYQRDQLRGATDLELTRCWSHVLAAAPPARLPIVWAQFKAAAIQPNYMIYNNVLWGLARTRNSIRVGHDANEILSSMTDAGFPPQASHYSAVITACTNSSASDAASRADKLLQASEKRYCYTQQEWDRPRIDVYTNVIKAYGRSKTPLQALDVYHRMKDGEYAEPDVIVYGALIHALGLAKSVEAAEQAETILLEMEHAATFGQREELRPNTYIYTSCIKAWSMSTSENAPYRAEQLIGRLEDAFNATGKKDLKPDSVCYGTLVDAWARSRHPDAGNKAETWLRRFHDAGGTMNCIMYTNVIAAWWRSKADQPERALALLQEMKDECAKGNSEAAPDNRTYTTVIQTIAASSRPDKAIWAWKLVEEMSAAYISGNELLKPTAFPFTAVLNACAFTRSEANIADAFRIALLVLNEMHALDISPNHVAYRTALSVFFPRNNGDVRMEKESKEITDVIFNRCCQDGQVHPEIVELLRLHRPEVYGRIPRNISTGKVQLPPEWTINVHERNSF